MKFWWENSIYLETHAILSLVDPLHRGQHPLFVSFLLRIMFLQRTIQSMILFIVPSYDRYPGPTADSRIFMGAYMNFMALIASVHTLPRGAVMGVLKKSLLYPIFTYKVKGTAHSSMPLDPGALFGVWGNQKDELQKRKG